MLKSTKRKPQPNEGVTDTKDQDSGCDGFNIGMVARGDLKLMIRIQWPKVEV